MNSLRKWLLALPLVAFGIGALPDEAQAADVETETVHQSEAVDAIYFKNTTGKEVFVTIEITDCNNASPCGVASSNARIGPRSNIVQRVSRNDSSKSWSYSFKFDWK